MHDPLRSTAAPLLFVRFKGDLILRKDLPAPEKVQWTSRSRGLFVEAVKGGLLTEQELNERYKVTSEQLAKPEVKKPPQSPKPKPEPKPPRPREKFEGLNVPTSGKLKFSQIEVDLNTKGVTAEDSPVGLEPKEFLVLVLLLSRKGVATTRRQLIGTLQDAGHDVGLSSIDSIIDGLRTKLGRSGGCIESRKGAGLFLKVLLKSRL
jgi:hypothetical protein